MAAALYLAGCQDGGSFNRPIDDVVATEAGLYDVHLVLPGPITAGAQTGTAEVFLDGALTPATLAVDAFMPAHVHGMGADPVVAEVEPGRFSLAWTWPMSGAWQVVVAVDCASGPDEAVFDVGVD